MKIKLRKQFSLLEPDSMPTLSSLPDSLPWSATSFTYNFFFDSAIYRTSQNAPNLADQSQPTPTNHNRNGVRRHMLSWACSEGGVTTESGLTAVSGWILTPHTPVAWQQSFATGVATARSPAQASSQLRNQLLPKRRLRVASKADCS